MRNSWDPWPEVAGGEPVAYLHASLLGMERCKRQEAVRALSPSIRSALQAYALNVQAQLELAGQRRERQQPAQPLQPDQAELPSDAEEETASRLTVLRRKREILMRQNQAGGKSGGADGPQAALPPGVRPLAANRRSLGHLERLKRTDDGEETDSSHAVSEPDSTELKRLQYKLLHQKRELLELKCARMTLLAAQRELPERIAQLQGKLTELVRDQGTLSDEMHAMDAGMSAVDFDGADEGGDFEVGTLASSSSTSSSRSRARVSSRQAMESRVALDRALSRLNFRQHALEHDSDLDSDIVPHTSIPSSCSASSTEDDIQDARADYDYAEPSAAFPPAPSLRWGGRRFWTVRAPSPRSETASGPRYEDEGATLPSGEEDASAFEDLRVDAAPLPVDFAAGSCSSTPSSPSSSPKHQVVFRPRNVKPLGRLQLAGFDNNSKPVPHARLSFELPDIMFQRRALDESGVDGELVRHWLRGRISGPLCLAKMLEGMQSCRWSSDKCRRDLSTLEDLYAGGLSKGYGGLLGVMVGGVARALAADASVCFGGALTHDGGPHAAVEQACKSMREMAGVPDTRGSKADVFDGLNDQQVNLSFRRRCLENHPNRQGGCLHWYMRAHFDHEVLRQWMLLGLEQNMGMVESKVPTACLSDGDLLREMNKTEPQVLGDSQSASEGQCRRWNDSISSQILHLCWQKEMLEAELGQLRSHGFYDILGVSPEATDAELARAYKLQALRLHPDRSGGSSEAFQVLQAAYEHLLEMRGGSAVTRSRCNTPGQRKRDEGPIVVATGPDHTECGTAASPHQSVDATRKHAQHQENVQGNPLEQDESVLERSGEEPKLASTTASAHSLADDDACGLDGARRAEGGNSEDVQSPERFPERVEEEDQDFVASQGSDPSAGQTRSPRSDDAADTQDCESRAGAEECFVGGSEALGKVIESIPCEAMSRQAELALDGARMCSKIALLCEEAAKVGHTCWPQLKMLARQCFDIAGHVSDVTLTMGARASAVPGELIPVIDTSSAAGSLPRRQGRKVVAAVKSLIEATEQVSDMGSVAMKHASKLAEGVERMREAFDGVSDGGGVSTSACDATASLVMTLSRLVADTAGCVSSAALAAGDAQQTARNYVEVLGEAEVWAKQEEEKEREEPTQKEGADDASDDDSEAEPSPCDKRLKRHRLLRQLNGEVIALQKELRKMVVASPSLIEAVSGPQKREIFGLVAELIEGARANVAETRCWQRPTGHDGSAIGTEGALEFVYAAAAWDTLAVPSLDARLLRLASLIDCDLLWSMLHERLLAHTLASAEADGASAVCRERLAVEFRELNFAFRAGLAGG